jgi:hypothetical protein
MKVASRSRHGRPWSARRRLRLSPKRQKLRPATLEFSSYGEMAVPRSGRKVTRSSYSSISKLPRLASTAIEIAWVFEDGRSRSHLIAPARNWTDSSADAEGIHGVTRTKLADDVPVPLVVQVKMATLSNHDLYASSRSSEGKWKRLTGH